VVAAEFAAFEPGYVTIWDSGAAGAWPGSRSDLRNVAGRLDDLRSNTVPPELDARPAQTLGFYQRYEEIHARQVAVDPDHALHTQIETREDLDELREAGTLFEVFRYDVWAGVMAVEPGAQHGLRGYIVIELLLDPASAVTDTANIWAAYSHATSMLRATRFCWARFIQTTCRLTVRLLRAAASTLAARFSSTSDAITRPPGPGKVVG
jgi:hypothetical protein